jgi:hypothetical protein
MRWQGIFAWFFPLFEQRTPAAQASVDGARPNRKLGVAGAHSAPARSSDLMV